MQIDKNYQYSVVQFLELPYLYIDDYICVPNSWIKVRRTTDRRIAVAYPHEYPQLTKERVQKGDKVLSEWRLYKAVLKYETNSYEDANNFIKMKTNKESLKNTYSDIASIDHKLLPAAERDLNNSMLNDTMNSKVVESRVTGALENKISPKGAKILKHRLENRRKTLKSCKRARLADEDSNPSKSSLLQALLKNEQTRFDTRSTSVSSINEPTCSLKDTEQNVCTQQNLLNLRNQTFQIPGYSRKKLIIPDSDQLPWDASLRKMLRKTNETQFMNREIHSRGITDNILHAALSPTVRKSQIYQDFQKSQENPLSSIRQSCSQEITSTQESLGRINSDPKDPCSDSTQYIPPLGLSSVNQDYRHKTLYQYMFGKRSTEVANFEQGNLQGTEQNTPFDVWNLSNLANQFRQIPKLSPFSPNFSLQVPYSQEIPNRQYSGADGDNHILGSHSRSMDTLLAAPGCSTVQSTCNEYVHEKKYLPNDNYDTPQDLCMQNMAVDGSTEANSTDQSSHSKKSAEQVSFTIPNSLNEMNQLCQSIQCLIEKRIQTVDEASTDIVSSTQNVDRDEQSRSTKVSTGTKLITSQNSDEHGKKSIDSLTNIEEDWLEQSADLLKKMNTEITQTWKAANELRDSLLQSAQSFQSVASTITSLRNLKKNKATIAEPDEITSEVQKVIEKKEAGVREAEHSDENMKEDNESHSKKSVDNDLDGNSYKTNIDEDEDKNENEDKDTEARKKSHRHIRTFVLPPEYDPDDTKWTLKYREPESAPGLTELIPQSDVFINSIKLAHCKRVSKDCKTLARMLLVEIFSQSALSVCSLTGARANAFNTSGTNVRPGLDEHARMVLLQFVEEHCCKKGWGTFDRQSIISSIRSKIQEIRAKYSQTA